MGEHASAKAAAPGYGNPSLGGSTKTTTSKQARKETETSHGKERGKSEEGESGTHREWTRSLPNISWHE